MISYILNYRNGGGGGRIKKTDTERPTETRRRGWRTDRLDEQNYKVEHSQLFMAGILPIRTALQEGLRCKMDDC